MVKVYLTRTKDIEVPLNNRTMLANGLSADILVSVHLNGHDDPAAGGTETFYRAGNDKGKKLAELLQAEMLAEFKLRNRGVKTNNLHMTREARMPAALTEAAFLSNSAEAALIKQKDFDERHGKAIAHGIIKYIEWAKLTDPVVVLDPGHGGGKTGAVSATGTIEKHSVLAACMVAACILRESKGEEPKTDPLKEAVDVLVKEGIISSPAYWTSNAVKGKTVNGEYVAAIIIEAAKKLRR